MSDYVNRGPDRGGDDGPGITGALMAQYLMAMLGHRGPFPDMLEGDAAARGRMGDYVFNQEALDQIITQLMENSNSSRPVAATEEVINGLPREVLTQGCDMLQNDCAVCKEQFKLETDDPDEQIIVTLPCKHPFHEPCILPWLKSSGTCPVCRHQLVPQPGQSNHPTSPGNNPGPSGPPPRPRSPGSGGHDNNGNHNGGVGFLQNLFGSMMGGGSSGAQSPNNTSTTSTSRSFSFHRSSPSPSHSRSPSDPSTNRSGSNSPTNFRRNSSSNSPSRSRPNNNNSRRDSHDRYLPGAWDALD
ncbi:hypothetical protein V5O48_005283 [Marasmius crinis-equi]|uniref:RING-type domain-containing protein n=1 Tax=Marasmius crinis-equi TaxID=585013 RepID=A0ABR3FMU7_9AGAR